MMISTPQRLAPSTKICKRSFNARTRCSARPFAFSAQLLSLVSAITIYRLYCTQLRASTLLDQSTMECFRNVSAAPSGTAQDLRIRCTALANGSPRTGSDLNLDFCTLLTVLYHCIVRVCCVCNCSAWVCCHSSHIEARHAPWIVHCMSRSLMSSSFLCCHFSFCSLLLVLMLSRLDVSQFSPRILQFPFQLTDCASLCFNMHTILNVSLFLSRDMFTFPSLLGCARKLSF